jgi:hypothetical protein
VGTKNLRTLFYIGATARETCNADHVFQIVKKPDGKELNWISKQPRKYGDHMQLDWKNINWTALIKSQVVQGLLGAVVLWLAAHIGKSIPPDQQTKLVSDMSDFASDAIPLLIAYAGYHRVTAQPEHATIIVPKKDNSNPPS